MKTWAWGALVVVMASAGAVIGCSSNSGGNGGGGGGGAGGAGTTTSSSSSSSSVASTSASTSTSTSTSTSSGGGLGSECKAQGQKCAQCCQMDFPMENNVFIGKYVLGNCACNMPDGGMALCATDCADNACKGMNPSMACQTCIQSKGIMMQDKCFTDAVAACLADATCKAVVECANKNCGP